MKIDRNTYYFLLTEYEEGYVTLIDFFETIKVNLINRRQPTLKILR